MDRLKREGNPPVGQLASPVPQYKDTVLNDWAELQGEGGASYVKDRDALAKLEQVKSELELVKAELAAIKANQLSGDQKVQLSNNKTRQVVFPREIRTVNQSKNVNLPIDKAVNAVEVLFIIYGLTGTFSQDEGARVRIITGSQAISTPWYLGRVESTWQRNTGAHLFVFRPGVTLDGVVPDSYRQLIAIPYVPDRLWINVDISGTFTSGQGVDCEVGLLWQ